MITKKFVLTVRIITLTVFIQFYPHLLLCDNTVKSDKLIDTAIDKSLHQHPYWRSLLHYKPLSLVKRTYNAEVVSEIDSDDFFLSYNGRNNPYEELITSIRILLVERDKDAINRFPARTRWLSEQLNPADFDLDNYFDDTYRSMAASADRLDSVKLIYAGEYLGNPASMFGHTFLRIDFTDETPLLGTTVEFSADTGNAGFFPYVIKGVTGGFQGFYRLNKYYMKVRDYSYAESRSVWEYELNLTQSEYRRLLDHIIEINESSSDYYFFTANCSYAILYLLEIARPGLSLIKKLSFPVIPLDTLKLVNSSGLISGVQYRPSIRERLEKRSESMNRTDLSRAAAVAREEESGESVVNESELSVERKAAILDFSREYYHYLNFPRVTAETFQAYQQLIMSHSRLRNRVDLVSDDVQVERSDPLDSHDNSLFSVGAGLKGTEEYIYGQYRFAYHAMSDPVSGYNPRASFVAGETELRLYNEDEGYHVQVERVSLFDIRSFSPIRSFSASPSYILSIGLNRTAHSKDELVPVLQVGAGGAIVPVEPLMLYLVPGIKADYKDSPDVAFSLAAGAHWVPHDRLVIYAESSVIRFLQNKPYLEIVTEAGATFSVNRSFALNIRGNYSYIMNKTDIKAGISLFF
ncbi:MAG: DUF4105 domain-containing protein [Spirochaetes bacterium]|jgi:hypothetical protein|nr:DUF4105 domain-containing protein [Spirochaetota bacterium]